MITLPIRILNLTPRRHPTKYTFPPRVNRAQISNAHLVLAIIDLHHHIMDTIHLHPAQYALQTSPPRTPRQVVVCGILRIYLYTRVIGRDSIALVGNFTVTKGIDLVGEMLDGVRYGLDAVAVAGRVDA